jgi:GNAT superfamily N-acetyltransferase
MPADLTADLHFVPLQAGIPKRLRAFRREAGWPNTPQRPPADMRGRVLWVSVTLRRQQIGIARLEVAAPAFCYIADFIISREWRGKGVGHWFIQQIERYCASLGVQRLLLEAAPGTAEFYGTLGFVPDQYVATMLCKNVAPLQARIFVPPASP